MIAAALLLASASPAPLTCGAATRPGVAEFGEDGVWRGRAVDLCHAVAERLAGPGAPIAFHSYDTPDGLRTAAQDRIAFASAAELATPALAGALRPGPTIAVERQVLIVPSDAPMSTGGDLRGKLVCFIIETRAEEALDAWAVRAGVPVERLAFQEPDEMQDALRVGKCAAEAVDAADPGPRTGTRVLGAPLSATPILATVPTAAGDSWRSLVTATIAAFHPPLALP